MHLTLLVSLFAVTICQNTNGNSTTAKNSTTSTTSPVHHSSLTQAKTNHVTSATAANANVSRQQPPLTSSRAGPTSGELPSVPQLTPNGTEVTQHSTQTADASPVTNRTLSEGPTAAYINATVTATATALPHGFGKSDLAENPGLVAVLCIFCIVLALALVVATVKCVRSPRASFERLEDVPMNKVNEGSPFAHYSK